MDQKAISVSQLGGYVKGIFDAEELLHNISVYGEISGLSVLRGNAFFSLKDENALLSCVFFGADEKALKNGDLIVATGTPRFYVKGGKLNFNVVKIEPFGVGQLFQKYLELKQKLESEGLFSKEHKKLIPKNVKKIGVVSSDKGAVIRDIINVSTRRNKGVSIVLFPARVQGEGADKDIIRGIEYFETRDDVDVVIVARGGGSFEDLMPFNSEELARAVYKSKKPIVSAVGHETDFTIIDFVSDLRAPTPSAGAELVVEQCLNKVSNVKQLWERLSNCVLRKAERAEQETISLKRDMNNAVCSLVNSKEYSIGLCVQALEKLNPKKVLERGFAKIEKEKENIISISQVSVGDRLQIYVKDGKLETKVENMEGKWN